MEENIAKEMEDDSPNGKWHIEQKWSGFAGMCPDKEKLFSVLSHELIKQYSSKTGRIMAQCKKSQ